MNLLQHIVLPVLSLAYSGLEMGILALVGGFTFLAITGFMLLIGFVFRLGFENGFLIDFIITIHELIISLLYLFIGTHILAATYHRLKKDGVWSSMVPFLKEKYKK